MRYVFLPAVAVIILASLFASGCNPTPPPARETTIVVRVRTPRVVDRPAVVRVSGSVEPRETAKVSFQVAGRVRRVLVDEGQPVQAGQLLAELDPTDYELGAAIAARQADAAEALARKAEAGARKQEVEQARAAFEQADDEYQRMKALYERKSLAPADFKKIEAKWRAARQQYDMAMEGARTEDKAAAEAQYRQALANRRLNEKRVEDTRLVSPLNGVVARRLVEAGEMVSAGMPVVAVIQLNPARVRVGAPEAEIGKLALGQRAVIRVPALDGRNFEGRVELLGHAAEPASRTFPVWIQVPNPHLDLKAGMIAEAEIETSGKVHALTLPGAAVVHDAQGATLVYVYFPEKKRVYGRRIETGGVLDGEVEIVSGLDPQALVVVAGQQLVREGSQVTLEPGGAQ